MLGYIPISLSPILRSVREIHPLESTSKILNASKMLKSGAYIREILAFSSSLSREICSLRDLTSSSSTSGLRVGYFLEGELDLSIDSLIGLDLMVSLRGDESLKGVQNLPDLVLCAAEEALAGDPQTVLVLSGEP